MLWFGFLFQKLWMKFRQYALAHLLKHCFWPPVYHLRRGEGLGEWTERKPELGFNFPDKPLKVQQDIMLLSCQWPFRQQHWLVFDCLMQLIFNLVMLPKKSVELSPNNNKYNETIPSMKCLRAISPSSLHPVPVVWIYSWFDQVSSKHPM